jgi:Fur family transcriptional regulator, zinc uptake regulator
MPLTANQQRVLATLVEAKRPLSAYAVLDKVRGAGFSAPTQVYRALDRLLEEGMVHRLESLNAYVSCTCAKGHSHGPMAFAICGECGGVDEIDDKGLQRALGRWAKSHAFALRNAAIELRGQCAACSAIAPQPRT